MRRLRLLAPIEAIVLGLLLLPPGPAQGGPRSGGSFGGRGGFRSGGGFSRGFSGGSGYRGGGGSPIFVSPGWGWGWGGYGFGGGCGPVGTLAMLAVLGVAAVAVLRAARRARLGEQGWEGDGDEAAPTPGRGYVYKVQIALGRSACGIQERLARFAAEGDTSSEAGLAQLLQQTALELLREKDSIRYGGVEAAGPLSLTNAETKMNGLTLAERSRFQVERVRGSEGHVRRSEQPAEEGREALEYVLVTVIVATRTPIESLRPVEDRSGLEAALAGLGGVSPDGLLGLEVIWTPADANDSMTETDLLTTYPELRGV